MSWVSSAKVMRYQTLRSIRCTRHDLLIKYVDVHAMDVSIADYSPKTGRMLSNF